jgi:hypothetical protein
VLLVFSMKKQPATVVQLLLGCRCHVHSVAALQKLQGNLQAASPLLTLLGKPSTRQKV